MITGFITFPILINFMNVCREPWKKICTDSLENLYIGSVVSGQNSQKNLKRIYKATSVNSDQIVDS
jgi:hypothetical protein